MQTYCICDFNILLKVSMTSKRKQLIHKEIMPWILSIRNPFWYACSNCDGDELQSRVICLWMLQHIWNDHTYCTHEAMDSLSEGKYLLDPNSQSMEIFREFCMDKRWLTSLRYYCRIFHTGLIEASESFFFTSLIKEISI